MTPSASRSSPGDGTLPSSSVPALPQSIKSIREILDEKVAPNQLIDILGLVRDFRPPVKTGGTDFKATVRLYDTSLEQSDEDLEFCIFRPKKEQFPELGAGDVIYAQSVKVQRWRNDPISCITHYSTRLHVFGASQIPKPPADATRALAKGQGLCPTPPSTQMLQLIPAFYHSIDRSRVPDRETFNLAASEAAKAPPPKNKSQELKNIGDGHFFDLVVQVARPPYDMADYVTLWVTDYTENPAFYHFSEDESVDEPYADPMGYGGAETQHWDGPPGKRSLQVTCWEPHATIIRSKVTKGSYVSLRNVQIRFGRNGANLEGFLRGDRRNPKKVNVEVLNPTEDPESVDERLKALIRRKRDFVREKKKKKQSKGGGSKGPKKRKGGEGEMPENSKIRRAKKRAGIQAKGQAKEKPQEEPMPENRAKLNPLVSCENSNKPPLTISSLLEPRYYEFVTDDQDRIRIVAPFTNQKCRVVVRVTDFSPNEIERFSVSRKISEYDLISDNESSDSEDFLSDEESTTGGPRTWEWSFSLQLEDASAEADPEPASVWVHVDNAEAQCLTGLNASDLKADPQGTANLRTQMAKLWGNLEEQKRKGVEQEAKARARRRDDLLAEDSDSETSQGGDKGMRSAEGINNRPFSCCVREYGIQKAEDDPEKANAGDGRRWQRVFGLFGTKIEYPADRDSSQ